jgi:hypothetical protein
LEAFQERVTPVVVGFATVRPLGAAGAVEAEGACVTTAVAAEVALVEPLRLDATTVNRNVEPASEGATTWEMPVAPLTGAQAEPVLSQRSHWYAYLILVPVQTPALPVTVAPTTGRPLMVGSAVFTGADPVEYFAAEPTLAKMLRRAANTPALAIQVLRDTTWPLSAPTPGALLPRTRVRGLASPPAGRCR